MFESDICPHYKCIPLDGMDHVRKLFPNGNADSLNWLFLSTSGVNGTFNTLDYIERHWSDDSNYVTALVLFPRLCVMYYGEIAITESDIPYLRNLVDSTIANVIESQEGNRRKSGDLK